MVSKAQVAIATLCAVLLAAAPAQCSLHESGLQDLPLGAHPSMDTGSLDTADAHQRSLSAERAAFVNGQNVPAWRGRMDTVFGRSYFAPASVTTKCNAATQNCSGLIPGQSFPYEEYLLDPTTPTGRPVMKVTYPAGAWSTSASVPGGTLFYSYPYKWEPASAADPFSGNGATMEYEVFFPSDFPFNRGGKLPGMGGGKSNGRGCGGGVDPSECFSYRIMWRRGGWGEAYLYVPHFMQDPEFCALKNCTGTNTVQPCTSCDYEAGVSFYRGSFVFQTGQWTKLRLHMTLNTPNVTDGVITLDVNGQRVIEFRKLNWRQYANIYIEGVTFATWFGGSDATWAPPFNTYALFRNFKMYYDGPGEGGRAAALSMDKPPSGWKGPVNVVEYIEEAD